MGYAMAMNAEPESEWFRALIMRELERVGGSQNRLSEHLAVHPSLVSRWVLGGSPRAEALPELLRRMGGDIRRAFPGWKPEAAAGPGAVPEGEAGSFPIVGVVNGRDDHAAAADAVREPEVAYGSVWRHLSPEAWQLTAGPVVGLRVEGTAMEPDYPSGCVVVCRVPQDPAMLADGMDCVFEGPGARWAFRRLQRAANGARGVVLGIPLNLREHQPLTWTPMQVKIAYVVLGTMKGTR